MSTTAAPAAFSPEFSAPMGSASCDPARAGAVTVDRREVQRSEFPYRLTLVPLRKDGTEREGGEITVWGRNISDRGIGFSHAGPLPHRRVRLRAADPRLAEIGMADFLVDVVLRWCRFVAPGQYESGGKITRTVD